MEEGSVAHIVTFLDKLAVQVPSLNAWDQFAWLPAAAIPWAPTEAELYGYCCSQVVDLGLVMPVAQFRVTAKAGNYLCMVRALVFKGSVLVYNPAMNEVEWVPACGLTNDLTQAKERSAIALENYVPCIHKEVAQIVRLGACCVVSWPNDSSTSEEEEGEEEQDPSNKLSTLSPSRVKRVRMKLDMQTRKKRQIGGNTRGTGGQSWGKRRDWYLMTCNLTLTLQGQIASGCLHHLCTPQVM